MGKQNNKKQYGFIMVINVIIIKDKSKAFESDQLDIKFWICSQPLDSQLGSKLQEVRDHVYF